MKRLQDRVAREHRTTRHVILTQCVRQAFQLCISRPTARTESEEVRALYAEWTCSCGTEEEGRGLRQRTLKKKQRDRREKAARKLFREKTGGKRQKAQKDPQAT